MTTTLPTEGFTAQEIDGTALRQDFVEKFLPEGETNYADHTMEELIELWEMSLGSAKARWSHLDVAAEERELDQWLSERGYIEPDYRA